MRELRKNDVLMLGASVAIFAVIQADGGEDVEKWCDSWCEEDHVSRDEQVWALADNGE